MDSITLGRQGPETHRPEETECWDRPAKMGNIVALTHSARQRTLRKTPNTPYRVLGGRAKVVGEGCGSCDVAWFRRLCK
jgi:hypothetical protein